MSLEIPCLGLMALYRWMQLVFSRRRMVGGSAGEKAYEW
jgi:hypothetical protein